MPFGSAWLIVIPVRRHMTSAIAVESWQTCSAVLALWDINLIPFPMLRVFLRKAAAYFARDAI